ncbi:MAG TPA: helix-turn-helix domain-containing protein [Acidimicrobiales bacterium]|nr:helix-turn-helix domain-containing protein [Acidimicrobiales bacterium]
MLVPQSPTGERSEGSLVPDPRRQPTITVKEAAALLGISERSAYDAVHRGEIPVIRLGRRMTVPTVPILRMLGLGEVSDSATGVTR